MVGLNKIKVALGLLLLMTFGYWFSLYRFAPDKDLLQLTDLLFLNFSRFEAYNLMKFNIERIIFYILLFSFIYHPQISIVLEDTSFLGMFAHKKSKKESSLNIIKESVLDNLFILLILFGSVLLISLTAKPLIGKSFEIDVLLLLKLFLYLLRILIFVCTFLICLRFKALIKSSNYDLTIPYFILIALIMIDYGFGTSLITISSQLSSEWLYLGLTGLVSFGAVFISLKKIYKSKEFCND